MSESTLISLRSEVENLVRLVAQKNGVSAATVRNTATLLGLQIYVSLGKQPSSADYTRLIEAVRKVVENN